MLKVGNILCCEQFRVFQDGSLVGLLCVLFTFPLSQPNRDILLSVSELLVSLLLKCSLITWIDIILNELLLKFLVCLLTEELYDMLSIDTKWLFWLFSLLNENFPFPFNLLQDLNIIFRQIFLCWVSHIIHARLIHDG